MTVELDDTVAAAHTVTDAGGPPPRLAPSSVAPGTVLAHFRIDAPIGRGGMGEVWRATDLALDRPVALKVLPAAVARDEGRRERLFREARSQARLQHPNVCHIYYVGRQDGVVFFAMEEVVGESLAERLARGPLPPAEAVELIRQAALGLREAHRHGFTHRDVKPSNLMVDREGRVKVVDFGLVKAAATGGAAAARAADAADAAADVGADGGGVAAADADADAGSAAATAMVGTPLYMAPEQAAGRVVDARADIYALGATLHHLVSGRPPFDGASMDELLSRHRDEPRPRLDVGGGRRRTLSAVDAVVARMMAKRPEDRFADYDALIAELERVSPARTRPAGAVVRAIAAVIDFILVGIVASLIALVLGVDDNTPLVIALGALYVVVGLARFGTTVGRALLELEVVSVAGRRHPSWGRAVLRFAVEYGPMMATVIVQGIRDVVGGWPLGLVAGVMPILAVSWGLGEMLRAAWRSPDKRTLWDRAGGTMVRYRRGAPSGWGTAP